MTGQSQGTAKKALKLRRQAKLKKPNFVRPESWRYFRLKENWRRPRGLDHKTRIKYAGWPPGVSIGYRGPKITRGLHPSGYREVLTYNVEELKGIDPKTQAVRIAHTVGKRKRSKIFTEAKKKRITVLNIKQITPKEEELAEEKLEEKEEEKETVEPSKTEPKQDKARRRRRETKEQ
jgi:large subunit ribosomal protein L32e